MNRICAVCGKKMMQGYVVEEGIEYFCSEKCLTERYTIGQYEKMYVDGQAYWTSWGEEE